MILFSFGTDYSLAIVQISASMGLIPTLGI